jgi:glycosyltransferase involved in cell wall biosynthesis
MEQTVEYRALQTRAKEQLSRPKEFSVIIPAHNEETNLPLLVQRLHAILQKESLDGEIVIVDDGSTDKTWLVASQLTIQYGGIVKCVRQRKRAGKSSALQAGFDASSGSVIAMIDADLQYAPEELPKMLKALEQGYDIINGRRNFSHYPRSRRIVSKLYNKIARRFVGYTGHDLNCGIKVFRREVVQETKLRPGYHRYMVALAERNGFNVGEVDVELSPRPRGGSNYSTGRILEGIIDLIGLRIRLSFEERPMFLFGTSGLVLSTIGLLIGAYLGYLAFLGQPITLRPLTLISVFLFVTGIQFLSLGLLSEMLSGLREEVKSLRDNLKSTSEASS